MSRVNREASMTMRAAALQGVPVSRGQTRDFSIDQNPPPVGAEGLVARAQKVAAVAAAHADAVDAEARFPAEAIAAARSARLLGLAVPRGWAAEAPVLPTLPTFVMRSAVCAHLRP